MNCKEAIAELRKLATKALCFETSDSSHHMREREMYEALAVLTEMAEECERLKVYEPGLVYGLMKAWQERAEKAEAELATRKEIMAEDFLEITRLKAELLAAQAVNAKNGAVIIEQMAELARWKPLIEAAERVHVADTLCLTLNDYVTIEMEVLIRAALKCREEGK